MANTEMAVSRGGAHPVPVLFPDTANSQVVAISGASAQSAVVHAESDRSVRLAPNTDIWFAVGANPTAAPDTAGSSFLGSGAVEWIGLRGGHKIAAIQDSAAGQLSITPAEAR